MEFDSDLFDLSFNDMTMFSDQQYQSQPHKMVKAPSTSDFQDFCNEFAKNSYEDLGTVPEWSAPASQPDGQFQQHDERQSYQDDFDKKDNLEGLGPIDDGLQGLFSFDFGSDSQVVPDMTPGTSSVPEFLAPTVSQSSAAGLPQTPGFATDPYSWVQGLGGMPFGYPARPRPSDPEARQQSLNRYRDKKARRFNNSTKVRYEMRKVNADKRPRIKGRFVKPEELQRHLQDAVTSTTHA